jgi:hypothetical protein
VERRKVARLVVLLASILVALAVGEVAARLVPEPKSPYEPPYIDDEASVFRPTPGWTDGKVRITAQGLRDDDDVPLAKPAGEKRVLFLGDSFLYAARLAWKDVLTERIEARLPGARCLDACCPGWATSHERGFLERYGLAFSPDVVVVAFFVGNDVMEIASPDRFGVREDHSIEVHKRTPSLRSRILGHSALWRRIEATPFYRRIAHHRKADGTKPEEDVEARYYEIEQLRLEQWRKSAWDRPPLDDGWRKVELELARIRDLARGAGARVLVLAIPDEIQVDEVVRAETVRRSSPRIESLADYELDQPQRALAAICQRVELPLVDVLPAFREKGAKGGLYLRKPFDTHWNEDGHALATELLAPKIQALLAAK